MTDKLTIADTRKAARCALGSRRFWLNMGGTNKTFQDFIDNGYDLELARAVDDNDVRAAVKCADERIANERKAADAIKEESSDGR